MLKLTVAVTQQRVTALLNMNAEAKIGGCLFGIFYSLDSTTNGMYSEPWIFKRFKHVSANENKAAATPVNRMYSGILRQQFGPYASGYLPPMSGMNFGCIVFARICPRDYWLIMSNQLFYVMHGEYNVGIHREKPVKVEMVLLYGA